MELKMNLFANVGKELSALNDLTTNTYNGDKGFSQLGFDPIDRICTLFGRTGNLKESDSGVIAEMMACFHLEADLTLRLVQYVRDTRQGQGRKAIFSDFITKMIENFGMPDDVKNLLAKIPELGYLKDYLSIAMNLHNLGHFNAAMLVLLHYFELFNSKDEMTVSNAFKYAPRSSSKFKQLTPYFMCASGLITIKDWQESCRKSKNDVNKFLFSLNNFCLSKYQKMMSTHSKTVEKDITLGKVLTTEDFNKMPSRALARHRKHFSNMESFIDWKASLVKGEESVKVNSGAVSFAELTNEMLTKDDVQIAERQFKDKLNELVLNGDILPVVDLSVSMYDHTSGTYMGEDIITANAAIGLGIALAMSNKSAFNGLVMTFSDNPKFVDISNEQTILGKVKKVKKSCNDLSTNVDATIQLVLDTAKRNNIPANDMPKFLVFFSDMQFDQSYMIEYSDDAFIDRAKKMYENAGYKLPQIVFWNLSTDYNSALPITKHHTGVVCVSGYNHVLMNSLFKGELDPIKMILDVLMNDRYKL